jgi:hypothetical protein
MDGQTESPARTSYCPSSAPKVIGMLRLSQARFHRLPHLKLTNDAINLFAKLSRRTRRILVAPI